jgi:hypothetical protein
MAKDEKHTEDLNAMQLEHEEAIQSLQRLHQQAVNDLQAKLDQRLVQKMEIEFNEKLEDLRRELSQEFEAQIKLSHDQVKALESNCDELLAKLAIRESEKNHLQVQLLELTDVMEELTAKNKLCEERLVSLSKDHEAQWEEV